MNMAAASTSPAQGPLHLRCGALLHPVRPVRDLPDGGAALCGSVREQGGGPSGCKGLPTGRLPRRGQAPPPPDRRRRRSSFLARLFRP